MQNFKIAVAQIPSEKGNVGKNIDDHVEVINLASKCGVSLVVFPELSLTGYELELADSLALTIDDERLKALSSMAEKNCIWVIVGAPIRHESQLHIGAIIFSPNGTISTYSKMNLHSGEDQYFQAGQAIKMLEMEGHKIAIAICADTNNPDHVKIYADKGASIYVAGALVTEGGYNSDTEKLATYAKQHNMLVAMANHNRPTGGLKPVGKSAAWSKDGLLTMAGENTSSLVISQQINGSWISGVVEM